MWSPKDISGNADHYLLLLLRRRRLFWLWMYRTTRMTFACRVASATLEFRFKSAPKLAITRPYRPCYPWAVSLAFSATRIDNNRQDVSAHSILQERIPICESRMYRIWVTRMSEALQFSPWVTQLEQRVLSSRIIDAASFHWRCMLCISYHARHANTTLPNL